MRLLLWLIALGVLAVGLALAARYNTGYALIVLPPWRIELSLNLLLLLEALGFVLLYLVLQSVVYTLRLPQTVRAYRLRRREQQAEQALANALRMRYEGRYGQALKSAATAYAAGYAPGLSALVAARAAHALRDQERESEWLARAAANDGDTRIARLMTEAELHLDAHRHAEALAVLDMLFASGQRHIAALRFAVRAHQALGDWRAVLRLARQLEKYQALTAEQASSLKLRAHQEHLRSLAADAAAIKAYWREIPAAERKAPRLAAEAARLLIALGECTDVQRIIEETLAAEWDSSLVLLYGECRGEDVLGRIAQAETWLKEYPRDACLLMVLGRLCREQHLWGKAQSYLEASLSIEPSREAHVELAQLADELARPEEADRHYRAAAAWPATPATRV